MSCAYREAVLDVARGSDEPLSTRQLLSGQQAGKEHPSGKLLPNFCKSARRIIPIDVLRYLAYMRVVFKQPPMLHLTIDGVNGGGDNQNVFFAFLSEKKIAAVPPLQAATGWRIITP